METEIQAMRRILESAGYTVVVTAITDGVVMGWLSHRGRTRHQSVGASALGVLVELARKAGITGIHANSENDAVVEEPNAQKDGAASASPARRSFLARP